jgi:small subunit ribosomal protein S9
MAVTNTSGRRKTAVARVYLQAGTGKFTINGKDYKVYFPTSLLQYVIEQPFLTIGSSIDQYDGNINVDGGGFKGQSEAVRLGISKALVKDNAEVKPKLRAKGLMTRDNRMVERKKPGQKKARKKFQFVKR